MKRTLTSFWLAAVAALIPLSAPAAGTARVQMANESPRVLPGACSCGFGLIWTLHFSTFFTEDPALANAELAPLPQPAAHTHWTYLVLEDPSLFASTTYAELNLPADDANGNGIPDFFEVSEAVSASSTGIYLIIWNPGYGQLSLQWSRAAGATSGSCVLYMNDSILGLMGPFTHTFELTRYTGQLAYTPGSNTVTGTISLAKDGQAGETLQGPVVLTRAPTNRFNLLVLSAGDWAAPLGAFSFGESEWRRNPMQPTLYQGPLQNPGGTFRNWRIFIVETNDANGNGIPDLSDDLPVVSPPRRPVLALALAPTNLLLRVNGDVGRTHLVQQAFAPNATNWATIRSLTLTNDPQVLTLPLPVASPSFWRVQVQ